MFSKHVQNIEHSTQSASRPSLVRVWGRLPHGSRVPRHPFVPHPPRHDRGPPPRHQPKRGRGLQIGPKLMPQGGDAERDGDTETEKKTETERARDRDGDRERDKQGPHHPALDVGEGEA